MHHLVVKNPISRKIKEKTISKKILEDPSNLSGVVNIDKDERKINVLFLTSKQDSTPEKYQKQFQV